VGKQNREHAYRHSPPSMNREPRKKGKVRARPGPRLGQPGSKRVLRNGIRRNSPRLRTATAGESHLKGRSTEKGVFQVHASASLDKKFHRGGVRARNTKGGDGSFSYTVERETPKPPMEKRAHEVKHHQRMRTQLSRAAKN